MTKEKKEELSNDIRVSLKVWGVLYGIANEVRVATGKRCTPNEILTANIREGNITSKPVLERRKKEDEEEPPVVDEGEKKRKSLLEAAIEDKAGRDKAKPEKEKEEKNEQMD